LLQLRQERREAGRGWAGWGRAACRGWEAQQLTELPFFNPAQHRICAALTSRMRRRQESGNTTASASTAMTTRPSPATSQAGAPPGNNSCDAMMPVSASRQRSPARFPNSSRMRHTSAVTCRGTAPAGQHRAEQSRAEQSRAEQRGAGVCECVGSGISCGMAVKGRDARGRERESRLGQRLPKQTAAAPTPAQSCALGRWHQHTAWGPAGRGPAGRPAGRQPGTLNLFCTCR